MKSVYPLQVSTGKNCSIFNVNSGYESSINLSSFSALRISVSCHGHHPSVCKTEILPLQDAARLQKPASG